MHKEILVIDESLMFNLELSIILKDYDINIIGAKNEIEAENIAMSKEKTVRLIIWVINTKDYLEINCIRKTKKKKPFRDIPLFIVSPIADKKYIVNAIEAGADDYVIKPYEKADILDKVKKYLGIVDEKSTNLDKYNDEMVIYNFSECLNKEIKSASRAGYSLTILAIKFAFDDLYIRDDLNDVIRIALKSLLRDTDVVFAFRNSIIVLLPFTDNNGAETVKAKIEKNIKNHSIIQKSGKLINFKIDYVIFPDDGRIMENLIERLEKKVGIKNN